MQPPGAAGSPSLFHIPGAREEDRIQTRPHGGCWKASWGMRNGTGDRSQVFAYVGTRLPSIPSRPYLFSEVGINSLSSRKFALILPPTPTPKRQLAGSYTSLLSDLPNKHKTRDGAREQSVGGGGAVSDFHSPTSPAGGVTAAHLIPFPEIELSLLEGRQSKSIRKGPVAITTPLCPLLLMLH